MNKYGISVIVLICSIFCNSVVTAQNIFKEKFDNCRSMSFCLDCGETKATPSVELINYLHDKLPARLVNKATGVLHFQILIDTNGNPCVLSSEDKLDPVKLKYALKDIINEMPQWKPAIKKGKAENSSRILEITFNSGAINYKFLSLDLSKQTNRREVGEVKIDNTSYKYAAYDGAEKIEVFDKSNSAVPWDMSYEMCIDSSSAVWTCTGEGGIVKIDSAGKMSVYNSSNSPFTGRNGHTVTMSSCAVDKYNNKWFVAVNKVFRFNDTLWKVFDTTNAPIGKVGHLCVDNSNVIWVSSFYGLLKFKENSWSFISYDSLQITNDFITDLFADSKGRVWLSSQKGKAYMLQNGKLENFQSTNSPLKEFGIKTAHEDKDGNIWFILKSKDPKEHPGLLKLSNNGEWTELNTENSGLPGNNLWDFTFDSYNNLWVSVYKMGLAYFDGNKWSILTPENSKYPSAFSARIRFDKKGILWGATMAGIAKITFKTK